METKKGSQIACIITIVSSLLFSGSFYLNIDARLGYLMFFGAVFLAIVSLFLATISIRKAEKGETVAILSGLAIFVDLVIIILGALLIYLFFFDTGNWMRL